HGLSRRREEVASVLVQVRALRAPKPQISFVNQGGGLERLARFFLSELLRRQFAQLLVHQRQQLLRGVGIALLDGGQDAGDFVHQRTPEVQVSIPSTWPPSENRLTKTGRRT